LLTPWMKEPVSSAYLEYDGNRHQVATSNRLKAVAGQVCAHYAPDQSGDPLFDIRRPVVAQACDEDMAPRTGRQRLPWWLWLWRALGLG